LCSPVVVKELCRIVDTQHKHYAFFYARKSTHLRCRLFGSMIIEIVIAGELSNITSTIENLVQMAVNKSVV